jgi:hypothetical protein
MAQVAEAGLTLLVQEMVAQFAPAGDDEGRGRRCAGRARLQ